MNRELDMKNVIFAMSKAAVEQHLSPTISALTFASVALGKVGGRKDHLMLDIVKNIGLQEGRPVVGNREDLQKHVREVLNSGAMKFRPSAPFKAFSATLEVWLDKGSISITQNAGSMTPFVSAQASRQKSASELSERATNAGRLTPVSRC